LKEKKSKKDNGREKKRKSGGLAYVFDGAVRGALDAYAGGRGFFRGLSRRIDVCGRSWLLFCGNAEAGPRRLSRNRACAAILSIPKTAWHQNIVCRYGFSPKTLYT